MKIKILLISIVSLMFVLTFNTGIFAQTTSPYQTSNPSGPAVIDTLQNPAAASGVQDIGGFVALLKNFLYTVVGLVLAGVILYGGFLYMTSQGEPEQIKKAQSILLYGVIGIAVIALSVIIIQLVAKIIGVDVSSFL